MLQTLHDGCMHASEKMDWCVVQSLTPPPHDSRSSKHSGTTGEDDSARGVYSNTTHADSTILVNY